MPIAKVCGCFSASAMRRHSAPMRFAASSSPSQNSTMLNTAWQLTLRFCPNR